MDAVKKSKKARDSEAADCQESVRIVVAGEAV